MISALLASVGNVDDDFAKCILYISTVDFITTTQAIEKKSKTNPKRTKLMAAIMQKVCAEEASPHKIEHELTFKFDEPEFNEEHVHPSEQKISA